MYRKVGMPLLIPTDHHIVVIWQLGSCECSTRIVPRPQRYTKILQLVIKSKNDEEKQRM